MVPFIIFITAAVNITLGILSYKKNPKSATNILLAILASIFAFWTVANYFSVNSATEHETLFWIQTVMLITSPLGPVIYLFVKAFPSSYIKVNKAVFIVLSLATLTLAGLAYTPFIFSGVSLTNGVTPTPGPGIAIFGVLLLTTFIASIVEIVKKYKKSMGIEKLQLRYLLLGISVTFGLQIITNYIFAILLKYSDFVIFGPIFSLIFVGFIFYAIVRHRLLAIRLILARSVAYTFLIAVLASIYTLGIFFISRYLFQSDTESEQRLTSALLAIFIVLTFEPLKRSIEQATDRVFFRGKYNTDELLLELTTLSASTIKLKDLTQKILEKILDRLQIENGSFIIYRKNNRYTIVSAGFRKVPVYKKEFIDRIFDSKQLVVLDEEKDKNIRHFMHQLNSTVAIPLSERDQNEGLLLLGGKKSGEIYTPQDLKMLEIFGPIMSIAIQNAKSYEEIKSFNKTLSDKVSSATQELQVSHMKLKELDKQKDKFLGMASHELKTPITSIKAFTQVLQMRVGKSNNKEYIPLLANINTQTDRVTKLINDLLNVSNIEAGKLVLKENLFDCDALVEKTVSDMQYTSDKHTIVKEGTINRMVWGDADRIAQVIANLLTNAIKYSPDTNKITVKVQEDAKNVIISVADTGPGIEKHDQKKIFERFYRTKEHEERNIAGFGLGLYISSEIVRRHGGKIWVDSTPGKGSVFSFSIPFRHK